MKKRFSSLLLVMTLFASMLLPVSADCSMLATTDTWIKVTAENVAALDLANQTNCYIIRYHNTCGYSNHWVPQFYQLANQKGYKIYAIDDGTRDFDLGGLFQTMPSGKYPYIEEHDGGEVYKYSSVHSLQMFEAIVTGNGKQIVGDFVVKFGALARYRGTASNLVIPTNLGITSVRSRCFDGNTTLQTVTIPEGVTTIGERAFYNCTVLRDVRLPSTLTGIDSFNFLGCYNLQNMYFAGSRPTFGTNSPLGSGSSNSELNSGHFAAILPQGNASWSNLTDLKTAYPHINWGGAVGQIRPVPDSGTLTGKADSWAIPHVAQAISYGLRPDSLRGYSSYTKAVTREHFCRIVMNLIYKQIGEQSSAIQSLPTQSPFTDTAHYEIRRAYYLGLVSGTGDKTFSPSKTITRQEAAVMLQAAGKYLGLKAPATAKVYPDENSIAPWAAEAVDYVTALGIMSGTDKGFEPLGTYSYQQAYCTFLNLYKLASAA